MCIRDRDKREQLLEELNGVVGKVKEGFNSDVYKRQVLVTMPRKTKLTIN